VFTYSACICLVEDTYERVGVKLRKAGTGRTAAVRRTITAGARLEDPMTADLRAADDTIRGSMGIRERCGSLFEEAK
jgi:hypothetical protein